MTMTMRQREQMMRLDGLANRAVRERDEARAAQAKAEKAAAAAEELMRRTVLDTSAILADNVRLRAAVEALTTALARRTPEGE